jgi:hypothetical protein
MNTCRTQALGRRLSCAAIAASLVAGTARGQAYRAVTPPNDSWDSSIFIKHISGGRGFGSRQPRNGQQSPIVWNIPDQVIPLPMPSNARQASALRGMADGSVFGAIWFEGARYYKPAIWRESEDGYELSIIDTTGYVGGVLIEFNSHGDAVGAVLVEEADGNFSHRPARWSEQAGWQELDILDPTPEAWTSTANAINESGEIVGSAGFYNSEGQWLNYACYWKQDGSIVLVPSEAPQSRGGFVDINEQGIAAGSTMMSDPSTGRVREAAIFWDVRNEASVPSQILEYGVLATSITESGDAGLALEAEQFEWPVGVYLGGKVQQFVYFAPTVGGFSYVPTTYVYDDGKILTYYEDEFLDAESVVLIPVDCAADWDLSGGAPNSSDFLAFLNDLADGRPEAFLAAPESFGWSDHLLRFLNLYLECAP